MIASGLADRRIVVDSRRVTAGDVFVCLRGAHVDGHDFALEAARRGASTVVSEHRIDELPAGVECVVVPDTHRALSSLAAARFGQPSRALRCAGITGTNGKTTVTYLLRAILEEAGLPCAVVGTLGARFGDRTWTLENTTPLALELQELLAEVGAAGARAVAMEVSSHALALHRADDVELDVAGFTNLSQDHLDFHGTLESYARAKRALFAGLLSRSDRQPERMKPAGTAVLNLDDPIAREWLAGAAPWGPWPVERSRTLTYGFKGLGVAGGSAAPALRAENVELLPFGTRMRLVLRDGAARSDPLVLALPGAFNVSNALCAAACAVAMDVPLAAAARGLARVHAVPGRMERVVVAAEHSARETSRPAVIVDYAHTPDGLASVLDAVRPAIRGRLCVVFGAGGDRDRGKRPLMGAAVAERADDIYVTSDNPRSEDPLAIVHEVLAGVERATARGARACVHVEPDREAAIRAAVAGAAADDVVVVAGKGHEEFQIVGAQRRPFSDAAVARAALEAWEP